jgi:hypothetical protein
LANISAKLKEKTDESIVQKKRADAAQKEAATYKQRYEETFKRLALAEQNLKQKDEAIERLRQEKNKIAKSKEKRIQMLDARSKAVMLKIVKTGEAARTALELFEKTGGNKKKDHAWNPPEDEAKAQEVMNDVVANDYTNFPGDNDVFTAADNKLFGRQNDGGFIPPPQGPTFKYTLFKEQFATDIIVNGEVSSHPKFALIPRHHGDLAFNCHVRIFVFQLRIFCLNKYGIQISRISQGRRK